MIDPAVIAINESDLSAATRANAFALLALVHPDNGHVRLEWTELAEVFRVQSRGAARRHLTRMVEAGLIHYSTNSYVYVTFEALAARPRADLARGRADSARGRAGEGEAEDEGAERGRADLARGRADSARGRADSARSLTRAQLVGWLDGSTIQPDQAPSNQPAEPQPDAEPSAELTDAQEAAFGLLTEIRMRPDKAAEIARTVPLPLIRDAVGAWWLNREAVGGKLHNQPGVVVAHLLGKRALLPLPSEAWASDPLNLRHRTRAEREADAAAEAEAERLAAQWEAEQQARPLAPQPSATRQPAPEPGTPEAFWRQLQSDFALHQAAGSVDSVIQDSWVIGYEDGVFTVGIADAFRLDWVEKKLRNQIKRRLAVIMRLATVDVRFVVAEVQP